LKISSASGITSRIDCLIDTSVAEVTPSLVEGRPATGEERERS